MTGAAAPTGEDARRMAHELVLHVAASPGAPLNFHGIDLRPALEQVLFTTIRAGRVPRRTLRARLAASARGPAAVASALRRRPAVTRADVLVILLARVHRALFAPISEVLRQDHSDLVIQVVRGGRAARDADMHDLPSVNGLSTLRSASRAAWHAIDHRAFESETSCGRATDPAAAAPWGQFIADTIRRLVVEAARLDGAVSAARPRAVVTYDEIDAWGRLVTSIAHRHGARAVDLPHAEAVDVAAIRGVAYDAMGVYGPRAAQTLEDAGVPRSRISVVGAAHFDAIIRAGEQQRSPETPPRVVLAGQYRGGRMTDGVRAGVLAGALSAADALAASLDVVPHPTESASPWEGLLAAAAITRSTRARVCPPGTLHDVLPGAALLVTGWSNSVYEAVLAGVPPLTMHLLEGEPPMPFAAEGLALEARSTDEAYRSAKALADPDARQAALAAARKSLEDHLGPLDGQASNRTARLVAEACGA